MRKSWGVLGAVAVAGLVLAGCLSPGVHQVTPTLMNNTASPGLWHTFGGNGCYWERLSGTGGTTAEIIVNFLSPSGPRYVEIKSTDAAFNSTGCLPWAQADGPFDKRIGAAADGSFGAGDYRVGPDIDAGSYTASIVASCTWSRVGAFTGDSADVIEKSTGVGAVTIDAADFGFQSTGCGTWKKT